MGFLHAFEKHLKDFEHGLFFRIFTKQLIIWGIFVIIAGILLKVARFPPLGLTPTIIGVALIALTFSLIYSFELYIAEKYEKIHRIHVNLPKFLSKGSKKPLFHIKVHKVRKAKRPKVKTETFRLRIKREKKKKSALQSRYKPVSKEYFKKK